MKIALVAYHLDADASHDCAASAEQAAHVSGLALALGARGHRVTVYARRHRAGLPDTVTLGRGVVKRYLTAGPAAPVPPQDLPAHVGAFGAELAHWLRRTAPDVVHAYHWTSGLAAQIAAREHPVPVVQSFGSLAAAERRTGLTRQPDGGRVRMEACVGRAAAGVLAATDEEARDLAMLGVPGYKVRVVPPGVDPARFGDGKAARLPAQPVRLLYIGPLGAGRRVDTLIRATAELPGAELVIAAALDQAAPEHDPDCKKLGKLAAELGVADRVTFTARPSEAELSRLLRSASVLVSAALHEPLGMTAISAMASGLPVVATGAGACADAVIDGTTGLLIPQARPELVAKAVRGLLATPMRLAGFGIAAADRAVSRYSWHRIAGEAAAAYELFLSLAGGPAGRAAVPTTKPARSARSAATPAQRLAA